MEGFFEVADPPRIDHALCITPDGRLALGVHRSTGGSDPDLAAGMISAIEGFVRTAIGEALDAGDSAPAAMGYKDHRILIESRPAGSLVVVLSGRETEILRDEMGRVLDGIVRSSGEEISHWDGALERMEPLRPALERFITSGRYDGVDTVVEPTDRLDRLVTNLLVGFRRLVARQPVLLSIDDLQWADPATVDLLAQLAGRLSTSPLVVAGSYRPDSIPADHPVRSLQAKAGTAVEFSEVELRRLDPKDAEVVVASLCGAELAEGAFGQRLVRETGGSPLLLREAVAFLRDSGALVEVAGTWRLAAPVERILVPSRARETILGRFEGLPRVVRDTLDCAAVLGDYFLPATLACVLGEPPEQVAARLLAVARSHSVVLPMQGGDRYRFEHPVVREVLYEEIPLAMRQEYHHAATDCLANAVGQGKRNLSALAHHARAGRHPAARRFLMEAAEAARRECLTDDALRLYAPALALAAGGERSLIVEAMGDTAATGGRPEVAEGHYATALLTCTEPTRRTELATKQALALERLGRLTEALRTLEAHPPGPRTPPVAAGHWLMARAQIAFRRFDGRSGVRDIHDALRTMERGAAAAEDLAECHAILGSHASNEIEYLEAASQFSAALGLLRESRSSHLVCRCLSALASCTASLGRLEEALAFARRARDGAERAGNRAFHADGYRKIGHTEYMLGRVPEAMEDLRRGATVAAEGGPTLLGGDFPRLLAFCELESGRLERAEELAREAVRSAESGAGYRQYARLCLAEVLLARGAHEESRALAQRVRDAAPPQQARGLRAWCQVLLAQAAVVRGDRRAATELFADAFSIWEGRIQAWEETTARLWWGEALASWGATDQARAVLGEVRPRLHAMGAVLRARRVDAALARLTAASPGPSAPAEPSGRLP